MYNPVWVSKNRLKHQLSIIVSGMFEAWNSLLEMLLMVFAVLNLETVWNSLHDVVAHKIWLYWHQTTQATSTEPNTSACSLLFHLAFKIVNTLTLILLTWRKWWAPNNASKQQMGFNSEFKGLKKILTTQVFWCSLSMFYTMHAVILLCIVTTDPQSKMFSF
jgi:hypothetical protein